MGRLGLGLGSGPHVVGRLWLGMRVSGSFQIIPHPMGRLGLGLGSEVQNPTSYVGRLGSKPRVGGYLWGIFGRGLTPGELSPGEVI